MAGVAGGENSSKRLPPPVVVEKWETIREVGIGEVLKMMERQK